MKKMTVRVIYFLDDEGIPAANVIYTVERRRFPKAVDRYYVDRILKVTGSSWEEVKRKVDLVIEEIKNIPPMEFREVEVTDE